MKFLVFLLFMCALCDYQINAFPGKFKSGGGSRGSSSSGSRGSSHSSWSTSWSKPASNPAPAYKPATSHTSHTSHSSSSNVALSYPSKPKPSAPAGSHNYPSQSGGSHGYPASTGLSGGSHSGGSHTYPSGTGLSGGSHAYPSGTGLSGGARAPAGTGGYQPYVPAGGAKPAYPATNTGYTSTNVKPVYSAPNQQSSNPSYPSGTGLSGNKPAYPAGSGLSGSHATSTNVKPNYNAAGGSHSYPTGTGLSGNKPAYPAGSGLSGTSGGHISNTNVRPNYNAPPAYSPNYQQPGGYHPYSHNQPPPPYSPGGYGGGYGGYHAPAYGGHHAPPTYFGNIQSPPNYPVFTPSYQPTYLQKSSSGIGIGTALATGALSGLAAYNLARVIGGSSNTRHVYHHYDNNDPQRHRNEPPQPPPQINARDLSNCTLSLTDEKGGSNVILIPCEIATSFAPDTPKPSANNSPIPLPPVGSTVGKESCTISVTRNGKVEETTIPCDFLTNLSKNATTPPEPLPPRISCSEQPQGSSDPNFTPCKFVDVLTDEEYLKVIPLKPEDNKLDNGPPNPPINNEPPKPVTVTEGTKMATEAILMDLDPADIKASTSPPSA